MNSIESNLQQFITKATSWFKKLSKIKQYAIMAFSGFTFLLLLLYFLLIADVFGPVPGKSELRNVDVPQASLIFADDGTLLGKYFIENRTSVEFDDLSPYLVEALIVTEDERYWDHKGIDWRSMGRVFFKTIVKGQKSSGGGSTISQQLAKNLFGRTNSGRFYLLFDKLREWIIASRLEKLYSKQDLLAMYFNTVPFGQNAFGINAASSVYFNTTPDKLTIEEAATLVGMLKATTTYNPLSNSDNSEERRNLVLNLMVQKGTLSKDALDSLVQLPLLVRPTLEDHKKGLATFFRESLKQELAEILAGMTKDNGEPYNMFTDGLKIYTSLDYVMQTYAEESVAEHMPLLQASLRLDWGKERPWRQDSIFLMDLIQRTKRYEHSKQSGMTDKEILERFDLPVPMKVYTETGEKDTILSPVDSLWHYMELLQCGLLLTDLNGYVKAWVGGVDFSFNQFDHVKARRHIGSTMKPIVYATALECGIDPCMYFANERRNYREYENYSPKNVDARYGGDFSFAGALNRSINVIAVEVGLMAGIDKVIEKAKAMGLAGPIPSEPGIFLGGFDATLKEMVEAYSVFANSGSRSRVKMIKKIENRFGEPVFIQKEESVEKTRVLDTATAEIMIELLKGVVERGTGSNAKWTYVPYWQIAGKTGTSQNYADGWFVGFSPDLIGAAWVGASSPKIHFRSSIYGQSNKTALPLWGLTFKKIDRDSAKRYLDYRANKFKRPDFRLLQKLDCAPGAYPIEEETDESEESTEEENTETEDI
jgi:penicillin-binding protein 1A